MKRALIIVLVLICLLGLVGCDPEGMKIDGDELLKNTVKIELFHYENTSPKLYERKSGKLPVFDFSKATRIAELDKSRFEDVINDVAKQDYLVYENILNEPIGKTMVLYQENGDLVVLYNCVYKERMKATRYYGEYIVFDENGKFIEYIGRVRRGYLDTLEATYFEN